MGAVSKRTPETKRDPVDELDAVTERAVELARTVAEGIRAERKAGMPYLPDARYRPSVAKRRRKTGGRKAH
jgi:hypothetical protein